MGDNAKVASGEGSGASMIIQSCYGVLKSPVHNTQVPHYTLRSTANSKPSIYAHSGMTHATAAPSELRRKSRRYTHLQSIVSIGTILADATIV